MTQPAIVPDGLFTHPSDSPKFPIEDFNPLEELEDDDEEQYESILDLWPDYPTQDEDFFFDEEEY